MRVCGCHITAFYLTVFKFSLASNLYFMLILSTGSNTSLLSSGLGQIFSAATTVVATTLIVLKIVLVTRKSRAGYSYTKVIEILIQSAALQSLVMIFASVVSFVEFSASEAKHVDVGLESMLLQVGGYSSSLRTMITVRIHIFVASAKVTC